MAESWLIRGGMDRERMLDMDRRIRPLRLTSLAVLGVCLIGVGPWIGYWTVIPLVIAGIFFKIAGNHTEGAARPEYILFGGWAASEIMIAASVAVTGGINSPALAWFAIPIVTLSARFSFRGVTVGVVTAVLMMVGVFFGVNTQAVLDDPPLLMASIAMLISTAILSTALMQSDFEHRSEAVIDQLTGLLNRTALRNRTAELSQRSEITAEPVGVIVADIDHFKRINDTFGHATGDAVLKDIAYVMRKELRAFDLAYRIGGEEFLVLLPGATIQETVQFAEALHGTVGRGTRGGQCVTMSFGVSASVYGEIFDYEKIFEQADAALYRAKESGRDRVCVAEHGDGHGRYDDVPVLRHARLSG